MMRNLYLQKLETLLITVQFLKHFISYVGLRYPTQIEECIIIFWGLNYQSFILLSTSLPGKTFTVGWFVTVFTKDVKRLYEQT